MAERYRVLSHTADTGIEVEGADFAELVANAAYGMFDLMYDLERLTPSARRTVAVHDVDRGELLVDVLAELLYVSESDDIAFCRFSASEPEAGTIVVEAAGVPLDDVELRGPPIKAITYHDLSVEQTESGWRARVVFDV